MRRLVMVFAVSLLVIVLNSCQKSEILDAIDETTLSVQDNQADKILTDVDLLIDEAIKLNLSELKSAMLAGSAYLNECPVITIDKDASPQVMTLYFGTSCEGKDGKIRSGKIIVTAPSFKTFPSERTKTFDNFYVDGKKIEGSVLKKITKDKENNIRTATIQENVTIVFPNDEGTAQRVTNFTREYHFNEIGNKDDDHTTSWGVVESTRINGVKVTKTISAENPLVFKAACRQIVSGIASFTSSKDRVWTINYGTGDCDNIAILTKGDIIKEITLK